MTEQAPATHDPYLWADELARIDEIKEADRSPEEAAVLDRILPESETEAFTSKSVRLAFYVGQTLREKIVEQFGGEDGLSALETQLGAQEIEGQFDIISALKPEQKAAAFEAYVQRELAEEEDE